MRKLFLILLLSGSAHAQDICYVGDESVEVPDGYRVVFVPEDTPDVVVITTELELIRAESEEEEDPDCSGLTLGSYCRDWVSDF